jgi:hypothetical protein
MAKFFKIITRETYDDREGKEKTDFGEYIAVGEDREEASENMAETIYGGTMANKPDKVEIVITQEKNIKK